MVRGTDPFKVGWLAAYHLGTVSASCPRPVVVFSEDAAPIPMQEALRAGVSAYVIAGLQPQRLLPVLQVAIARFEQDKALRGQLESAQSKLSERKLVDRAKGILMNAVGLSEEQAFAHPPAQAGDGPRSAPGAGGPARGRCAWDADAPDLR